MAVHPISFCLPEEKIIDFVPEKTKEFSHIVPGDYSTYIFETEDSYYKDYQISTFGRTWKKGGFDCLRHYEIMANGCIPHFRDIDSIPSLTMTHFPKDLVKRAMNAPDVERPLYCQQLLEYTKTHLTCRAMVQYVLRTIGQPNVSRVLFLNGDTAPDYLRCLLLIGFKQTFGSACTEWPIVPHIYKDYGPTDKLYGRGYTYTNIVDPSVKPKSDLNLNEKADLVVYGSLHRGLPYEKVIRNIYRDHQIVFFCGEDAHPHGPCPGHMYARKFKNHVFIRELG